MWRYLLLIGALGCGSQESRVCKHLTKLCGDDVIPSSCASDLGELKDSLGDSYGKMMSCADEAKSCPEVAGCFVGGVGNALNRWKDQFEHGAKKALGEDDPKSHDSHDSRDPGAACKSFHGEQLAARWDDCTDHVRREVVCETFIDDLKCECREDGVEKWSFHAKDPPLSAREGATRVARANCKMGSFDKL
jgi:hypothetical protein